MDESNTDIYLYPKYYKDGWIQYQYILISQVETESHYMLTHVVYSTKEQQPQRIQRASRH